MSFEPCAGTRSSAPNIMMLCTCMAGNCRIAPRSTVRSELSVQALDAVRCLGHRALTSAQLSKDAAPSTGELPMARLSFGRSETPAKPLGQEAAWPSSQHLWPPRASPRLKPLIINHVTKETLIRSGSSVHPVYPVLRPLETTNRFKAGLQQPAERYDAPADQPTNYS